MRQTKTENSGGRKECSACGAGLWLKDHTLGQFSGPWHFQECPSIPGGAELSVQNIADKEVWNQEEWVPRKIGGRILTAIKLMLSTRKDENGKPTKIYYDRKAAILEEIKKL